MPVVNLWAELLHRRFRETWPALQYHEKKFRFVASIDIDHAYAYKERSVERTLGGYGRSLIYGHWNKIVERTRVLLGMDQDPFDQYDFLKELHSKYNLEALYFILFADYGRNDNNVSVKGKKFRQLVRNLDTAGKLGIHPSLSSGRDPHTFNTELAGLKAVLGHEVKLSRQHFLKVSFPPSSTYFSYPSTSILTKSRLPFKLIFYEAFLDQKDALRREKYFKTNPGKRTLKLMLRSYHRQS